MAEIKNKIEQLRRKIAAKETRLKKLLGKISDAKSDIKELKREIAEMESEIRQLELEQLSETLSQNGITAADVAAAIAAGEIKKTPHDKNRADTCSTNSKDEEDLTDEVSDSGKAVGSA